MNRTPELTLVSRRESVTPLEPRLEPEGVLEVCNRVREAGGGRPLGALLPGIPGEEAECLIAKGLNFECGVMPSWDNIANHAACMAYADNSERAWFMFVADDGVRETISRVLGWPIVELPHEDDNKALLLPRELGRTAAAFDAELLDKSLYVRGDDDDEEDEGEE